MKKIYLLYAFLIVFVSSCGRVCTQYGQNGQDGGGIGIHGSGSVITQERAIAWDYSKIRAEGSLHLVLITGTVPTITIEADDNIIPYILTKVEKGILIIKLTTGFYIKRATKLEITVPHSYQNIAEISSRGSGNIKSRGVIVFDDISFKKEGSGDINIDVQAQNILLSSRGSSQATIDGKTEKLDIDKAGSGDIHAYGLLVSQLAKVRSRGSGSVEISVSDAGRLDATLQGSGDIIYKGRPTIVKNDAAGSGDIKRY